MGGARETSPCFAFPAALLLFGLCLAGLQPTCAIQCNVKNYGAKGDGKNNDTDSFKLFKPVPQKVFKNHDKAENDCFSATGGPSTVYVPSGSYSVWPLIFEKN